MYGITIFYAKCSWDVPSKFSTNFLIFGTDVFGHINNTSCVFTITILFKSIPTTNCPFKLNNNESLLSSRDRKSTRLNSSHQIISYAVFCLKKKKNSRQDDT